MRIRRGTVPGPSPGDATLAELHLEEGRGLAHSRTATGYRLSYFGFCEAHLRADLRELVLEKAPGRSDEDAALFLIGGIAAFILGLQGRPPLHGSAVHQTHRTLGFLGASGAGKSTLAALYCLRGARLLAEDLLAIGPDGSIAIGPTELRLRPAAAALAGRFPPEAVRTSTDGRFAVHCAPGGDPAPRLSALIAPVISADSTAVTLRRLLGTEAFLTLASSPRQLGLKDSRLIANAFSHFGWVARTFPVFEASIPASGLRDPDLPGELDRELSRLL